MKNGKVYFASDFHLGVPSHEESLKRERLAVQWLEEIRSDAEEIYLLGDVFDFWFEYKTVVPKGFVRLLGKLAEIRDSGVPIYYFTGNHDLWMFDYFEQELNIPIYRTWQSKEIKGKKFLMGHGDAVGPKDKGYKFLKKVFTNRFCQWLFSKVHPNVGIKIARYWSKKSRISEDEEKKRFLGEKNEWQVIFAKGILKKEHFDYFIFGHRHLPIDLKLGENSRFINLGDWVEHYTYAEFDGQKLELKHYQKH